jgi:Carboxypeptidase regulatory-like domain
LVTVSATHPSVEVRFALMRPGELTGTVMDENDKPLAGMLVEITMAGLASLAKATSRTGSDGAFAIRTLMPGEYIIKVSAPKSWITLLPKFTEDDVKIVDESLETLYWPGVSEVRSATPVRVSPGAPTSLGTIHLRQTPSYRARVSMKGCEPDDLPNFGIVPPNEGTLVVQNGSGPLPILPMSFSSVSSCDDVLVTGLKPGPYSFHLTSMRGWAAVPIEVANKNLEIALPLLPRMDISGRIVAGEGVTLPALDKIQITLLPTETGAGAKAAPNSKGAFLAAKLMGPSHRVSVNGLGDKYYVKEIRLDGHTVPDGVVHLYQGSQLEIVLDDQPAAITGSVTDGERPFSQPLVYVAKWPSLEVTLRPVTGDNDGQFHITGLEPGEYRVLAVRSAALPDGQQIGSQMLSNIWSDAEKVILERGGSQTVSLKLSDPLR